MLDGRGKGEDDRIARCTGRRRGEDAQEATRRRAGGDAEKRRRRREEAQEARRRSAGGEAKKFLPIQFLRLLVEPAGLLPADDGRAEVLLQGESCVFPPVAAHTEDGLGGLGVAEQSDGEPSDLDPADLRSIAPEVHL